jgi:methionyl-tRNA formyltransferase
VIFLGSKAAGLLLCRTLFDILPESTIKAIICPDDRLDARSVLDEFTLLSQKYSVPLHLTQRKDELEPLITQYSATTAIVHGWYQIIPLNTPCKFFGFHYAPLPKYRGNAPLVWQLINGEPEIGVSFFQFSEGMDEGPLVGQLTAPIDINSDISDALNIANSLMLDLAKANVPTMIQGENKLTTQPDIPASYCGQRIPADGKINWLLPCNQVHNFIRAQTTPYPGAFTFTSDGKQVTIFKSSIEPRTFYGAPGSVAEVNDNHVVVCCGSGAIRIHSAAIGNGEISSASLLFRSLKIRFA